MSHYSSAVCSDEELLEELRKLGYDNEISPDVFDMMKEDLDKLVEKEHSNNASDNDLNDHYSSPRHLTPPSNVYSDDYTKYNTKNSSDNFIHRKTKKKNSHLNYSVSDDRDNVLSPEISDFSPTIRSRKLKNNSNQSGRKKTSVREDYTDYLNSPSEYNDSYKVKSNNSFSKFQNESDEIKNDYTNYRKSNSVSKENTFHSNYSLDSNDLTQNTVISNKNKYKVSKNSTLPSNSIKGPKTYSFSSVENKLNNNSVMHAKNNVKTSKFGKGFSEDKSSDYYQNSNFDIDRTESSRNSEVKTMKRKVLRRRNGRSIITEEILEVPSIFDTSYPESETFTNSKSFSSDDLSYKSNGSTGSTVVLSPEASMKSSPSTLSLLSTRSSSFRVTNARKKKSDPVAMYGYYKKFWNNFKPPGENTHNRLRWSVRDRMLEYNF